LKRNKTVRRPTADIRVPKTGKLLSIPDQLKNRQMYDAFSNALARTGFGTDNLLEGTNYPLTRLTRNYILLQSLYRSNWIARKLIDCIAEDMFKNWLSLVLDKTPEEIDQFNRRVGDTGTQEKLLTAVKWARLFGGAGAVIILKNQGNQLDKPLEVEDVELDSYQGLLVFDRWSGINPSATINNDISKPEEFGLPESYYVTTETGKSFTVHNSRVLRFIGRSLPQWEWQAEQRWGISEYEVVFDELKKRDNTSWNIASLIFRANILALKQKDLSQMLSGIGSNAKALQQFYSALQAQSHLMSNQGLMVLPEDGGLDSHQYAFGGINDVYVSFMLDICGACEIPMSRLFGRTVTGLGQTGEGDEHAYYDLIGQKQKREVNPQLKKLFPIIAMSTWGEVPEDLDWQFNPVRTMSNEEQAELASKQTTAIVETYNAGIIGRQTGLKELKQISELTGMYSNITDEMIDAADDEPVAGEMELGASLKDMPGKEEKGLEVDESEKRGKGTKDSDGAGLRVQFAGLGVVIETPAGAARQFKNGSIVLKNSYGYITGSEGVDGDSVDCFLGPSQEAANVYVVHAQNPESLVFDEDKVMLGFASPQAARAAFLANYSQPEFFGSMEAVPLERFKVKLAERGKKITADAMDKDWQAELQKSQRIYGEVVGRKRLAERLSAYIGSFALRREFNQSMEEYFAKHPDERRSYEEALKFRNTVDAVRLSKQEVHFESPAKGPHHCAQCIHFEHGKDSCSIVEGLVKPEDWCEEYYSGKPNGKATQTVAVNA
jgi:hypothetical protein